jgi:hypothetical protein
MQLAQRKHVIRTGVHQMFARTNHVLINLVQQPVAIVRHVPGALAVSRLAIGVTRANNALVLAQMPAVLLESVAVEFLKPIISKK